MVISKEFYCDMKDYFYPNIRKFIHNYTCMEDNLFFLPPYHGCGLKKKTAQKSQLIIETENSACHLLGNK